VIFHQSIGMICLLILPLVLIAFPEFILALRRSQRNFARDRASYLGRAAIFLVCFFLVRKPESLGAFRLCALNAFLLTVFTSLFQGRFLKLVAGRTRPFLRRPKFFLSRPRDWMWTAFFLFYAALPIFFPIYEPFSFSMFAAKKMLQKARVIDLDSERQCGLFRRDFVLNWVSFFRAGPPGGQFACRIEIYSARMHAEIVGRICGDPRYGNLKLLECPSTPPKE
jgi:hypothetical protein